MASGTGADKVPLGMVRLDLTLNGTITTDEDLKHEFKDASMKYLMPKDLLYVVSMSVLEQLQAEGDVTPSTTPTNSPRGLRGWLSSPRSRAVQAAKDTREQISEMTEKILKRLPSVTRDATEVPPERPNSLAAFDEHLQRVMDCPRPELTDTAMARSKDAISVLRKDLAVHLRDTGLEYGLISLEQTLDSAGDLKAWSESYVEWEKRKASTALFGAKKRGQEVRERPTSEAAAASDAVDAAEAEHRPPEDLDDGHFWVNGTFCGSLMNDSSCYEIILPLKGTFIGGTVARALREIGDASITERARCLKLTGQQDESNDTNSAPNSWLQLAAAFEQKYGSAGTGSDAVSLANMNTTGGSEEKRAIEIENLRLKNEMDNLRTRNSSLINAVANQDGNGDTGPGRLSQPTFSRLSVSSGTEELRQASPLPLKAEEEQQQAPLQQRGSLFGQRDQPAWGDTLASQSSPSVSSTSRIPGLIPGLGSRATDASPSQPAAAGSSPWRSEASPSQPPAGSSPWRSSGYPGPGSTAPLTQPTIAGGLGEATFGSPYANRSNRSSELPKSPRFQSSGLAGLSSPASPDSGLPKSPRFQSSVLTGGSSPAKFGGGSTPGGAGGDLFKVQQDAAQEHQALVTDLRALEQWAQDLRARRS